MCAYASLCKIGLLVARKDLVDGASPMLPTYIHSKRLPYQISWKFSSHSEADFLIFFLYIVYRVTRDLHVVSYVARLLVSILNSVD